MNLQDVVLCLAGIFSVAAMLCLGALVFDRALGLSIRWSEWRQRKMKPGLWSTESYPAVPAASGALSRFRREDGFSEMKWAQGACWICGRRMMLVVRLMSERELKPIMDSCVVCQRHFGIFAQSERDAWSAEVAERRVEKQGAAGTGPEGEAKGG